MMQRYARFGGILILISLIAGGFGEAYVPSVLPSGIAAASATHGALFRAGYAAYLIEAICDVALTLVFYELLKPVNASVALLGVFFRLVSTATFAICEFFYFSASLVQPSNADLWLTMSGFGGEIFAVFYGCAALINGYLIVRSRYLPAWIGALLCLGGCGFILRNFLLVLAPDIQSEWMLAPMILSMLILAIWLLARGVDSNKRFDRASVGSVEPL
jgi:hypothetical protein